MDEIEVALGRGLLANSRTSYSELGRALGMTPQAVHRRVQDLMGAGMISDMGTYLTVKASGHMLVLVMGWSKCLSMDDLGERLKKQQAVAVLFAAGGNYIYILGTVKNADDMGRFVSMTQREAEVRDLQVGIIPTPPPSPRGTLTALDLRLVKALEDDPRRSLSEVARAVGVSAKTARRRIARMDSEGLISFTTHWWLEAQPDPVCNIHLTIREDAERDKIAYLLIKKIGAGTIRTYAFSNLPNLIVVTVWFKNGREMWQTCRELEAEGLFVSVVPNILRAIYYYDDHRKAFLAKMLDDISAPGTRER